MARGLNKVLLIGNLGKDPEMKYTPSGSPMTSFSVAVSRNWRTPDGENKEETEWFRIVAWDKLAEQCNEYLHKGRKVYLEGRLKTREYQGQDGQTRQITEVIAYEMIILDSRQTGPLDSGYGATEERPPMRSAAAPATSSPAPKSFDDDTDADDIPF